MFLKKGNFLKGIMRINSLTPESYSEFEVLFCIHPLNYKRLKKKVGSAVGDKGSGDAGVNQDWLPDTCFRCNVSKVCSVSL